MIIIFRKLLSFLLVITLVLGTVVVYSDTNTPDVAVEIVPLVKNNIYDIDEPINLQCIYTNNTTDRKSISVSLSVITGDGRKIWSDSMTAVLRAEGTTKKDVALSSIKERGKFRFVATVTADGGSSTTEYEFITVMPATVKDDMYAVCSHFGQVGNIYNQPNMAQIKDAGFTMIRDDYSWALIETTEGEYQLTERMLNGLQYAKDNGLEILAILGQSNALYCDSAIAMPTTESALLAYENYCKFMAKTLKDWGITYFEIYNEPDQYLDYKASDYAEVLKAGYRGVKAGNPEATVIGGALAGVWVQGRIDAWWYLPTVLKNAGDYMDIFSVHLYPYLDGYIFDEYSETITYEKVIDELQKYMNAYGYDKDIWITETGYSTVTKAGREFSEESQAVYDTRTAIIAKADGRASKIFKYEFKNSGSGDSTHNYNFGLVDINDNYKQGFAMNTAMIDLIGNSTFVDKIIQRDEVHKGYNIYRFRREDGTEVFAMWACSESEYNVNLIANDDVPCVKDLGNATLQLDLSMKHRESGFELYDAYGTKLKATTRLSLDYKPLYLVCKQSSISNLNQAQITYLDGKVSVDGVASDKNGRVALKVVDINTNKIVHADQCKADGWGNYSFNFMLDKSGSYSIYVYDGVVQSKTFGSKDITMMVNGTDKDELQLSQLAEGDVIVAVLNIGNDSRSTLYGAVYSNNSLKTICVGKTDEITNKKTLSIEVENLAQINQIKLFGWDDNNAPVTDVVIIE